MSNHSETKQKAKKATDEAKPWLRAIARSGYIAKGIVYILVGVLSVMAAVGVGGQTTDGSGAIAAVANEPFGNVLVWIIAIGLIIYGGWKIVQFFKGPSRENNKGKDVIMRITYLVSASIYLSLAYKSFSMLLSNQSSSSSSWLSIILDLPLGEWIVFSIGLIIASVGINEIINGYKEKFVDKFKFNEMSKKEIKLGKKVGRIGLIARGITFLVLGFFIMATGFTKDLQVEAGLDGALQKIAQQPFGQWMLGLVAIGLVLYGVFQIMKGKNRNMNIY
ncbi:DUF1206 domain-containing protein [Gracilibacillus massiliensis]|uniref:DUF1206 domain-containing protein n=1 Tax=Gracilibacillus massiliensis TaxID=1564956 RepID=UPI00071E67FF|nr:DUF1206 domain-containing protein [Gracilibacillus massiliensis]